MRNGTKYRLLYLYQILVQNSDEEHPISTSGLKRMLKEKYDIEVNRNTLGNDLDTLKQSGLHIEVIHSTQNKYYFDGRIFNEAELKILLDTVASSKFITERKSTQLMAKLLTQTSEINAAKLRRHLYTIGRVKSDNEKGYNNVDIINNAIDSKHKISFTYLEYDINKRRPLMDNGKVYIVSPYNVIWDGDYYYVIGYCDACDEVRTFRLDFIECEPVIIDEIIEPASDDFILAQYNNVSLQTISSEEMIFVELQCHNVLKNDMTEKFGMYTDAIPVDDEHFMIKVKACVGPKFFQWIFGYDGLVRINQPEIVRSKYIKMLKNALTE